MATPGQPKRKRPNKMSPPKKVMDLPGYICIKNVQRKVRLVKLYNVKYATRGCMALVTD